MLKMGRRIRLHALTSQLMMDPCLQYPTFLGNVKVKPCSFGKSPSLCKIYSLFISAVGLAVGEHLTSALHSWSKGTLFNSANHLRITFSSFSSFWLMGRLCSFSTEGYFLVQEPFILLQFLLKYLSIDLYIYSGVILSSFFTFKPCLFFLKILFFI